MRSKIISKTIRSIYSISFKDLKDSLKKRKPQNLREKVPVQDSEPWHKYRSETKLGWEGLGNLHVGEGEQIENSLHRKDRYKYSHNPNIWEAEAGDYPMLWVSSCYTVNTRLAWVRSETVSRNKDQAYSSSARVPALSVSSPAWWHMPVIPTLRWGEAEALEFKDSLTQRP